MLTQIFAHEPAQLPKGRWVFSHSLGPKKSRRTRKKMRRLILGYANDGGFEVAFTQAEKDPTAPVHVWVRRIRRRPAWDRGWQA